MQQVSLVEQLMELDHGRIALLMGMIAIIGSVLTVMVTMISYHWRKYREAELETQLKLAMLDDGMSAADIAAIIEAGRKSKRTYKRRDRARAWHEAREFARKGP